MEGGHIIYCGPSMSPDKETPRPTTALEAQRTLSRQLRVLFRGSSRRKWHVPSAGLPVIVPSRRTRSVQPHFDGHCLCCCCGAAIRVGDTFHAQLCNSCEVGDLIGEVEAAEPASAWTLLGPLRGCEEPRVIRFSCNREDSEERRWLFSYCFELRAVSSAPETLVVFYWL